MSLNPRLFLFATLLVSGLPIPALAQDSIAVEPIRGHERAALFPDRVTLEQGEILAATTCAACHGIDGISADKQRPNLAGQRTIYLYREILAYQNGDRVDESMSRAVRFLSDEAIMQVAVYYANLVPPRPVPGALDARDPGWLSESPLDDVKTTAAACGSCHGVTGNSVMPGMPSLTSQHPDYFEASMKAYQSGDRADSMMKTLASGLDDETIQNLGIYYAMQAPAAAGGKADGNAQAGRQLSESCAACHGADGNAASPGTPSIAGQDASYFIAAMNAYAAGQRQHSGMSTALAGLNEADIANLAAFYAAQEPGQRRVRAPLTANQWIERCDRCHGVNGNSTDPRYSALAAQNEAYLVRVLKEYAAGQRSDSIMHAMSAPLSDGMIARLAAFYSAQEPRAVVYFEPPCEGDDD